MSLLCGRVRFKTLIIPLFCSNSPIIRFARPCFPDNHLVYVYSTDCDSLFRPNRMGIGLTNIPEARRLRRDSNSRNIPPQRAYDESPSSNLKNISGKSVFERDDIRGAPAAAEHQQKKMEASVGESSEHENNGGSCSSPEDDNDGQEDDDDS